MSVTALLSSMSPSNESQHLRVVSRTPDTEGSYFYIKESGPRACDLPPYPMLIPAKTDRPHIADFS